MCPFWLLTPSPHRHAPAMASEQLVRRHIWVLAGLMLMVPALVNSASLTCGASVLAVKDDFDTVTIPFSALRQDLDGGPCSYGSPATFPWNKGHPPTSGTQLCDSVGQAMGCTKGVPLDHICNATTKPTCTNGLKTATSHWIGGAVVTERDDPGCVTDSYRDRATGQHILVHKTTAIDADGDQVAACIQQSEAGACGGIDCPCPGLYISGTAWSDASAGGALNPLRSVPPSIPFLVRPGDCGFKLGTFALVSKVAAPGEDPNDWIGAVIADTGPKSTDLGEMSSGLLQAIGAKHDITIRVFPAISLATKWQWGTAQGNSANVQLLEQTKRESLKPH
jgi:hypothetical protein